jgi:hypothetical protein
LVAATRQVTRPVSWSHRSTHRLSLRPSSEWQCPSPFFRFKTPIYEAAVVQTGGPYSLHVGATQQALQTLVAALPPPRLHMLCCCVDREQPPAVPTQQLHSRSGAAHIWINKLHSAWCPY